LHPPMIRLHPPMIRLCWPLIRLYWPILRSGSPVKRYMPHRQPAAAAFGGGPEIRQDRAAEPKNFSKGPRPPSTTHYQRRGVIKSPKKAGIPSDSDSDPFGSCSYRPWGHPGKDSRTTLRDMVLERGERPPPPSFGPPLPPFPIGRSRTCGKAFAPLYSRPEALPSPMQPIGSDRGNPTRDPYPRTPNSSPS